MEGLLARWTLAIQGNRFTIHYSRGYMGILTQVHYPERVTLIYGYTDATSQAPLQKSVIQELYTAQVVTVFYHKTLHQFSLSCYKQLWPQLFITDEIVCCCYAHFFSFTLNLINNNMIFLQLDIWDMKKLLPRYVIWNDELENVTRYWQILEEVHHIPAHSQLKPCSLIYPLGNLGKWLQLTFWKFQVE